MYRLGHVVPDGEMLYELNTCSCYNLAPAASTDEAYNLASHTVFLHLVYRVADGVPGEEIHID